MCLCVKWLHVVGKFKTTTARNVSDTMPHLFFFHVLQAL